MLKITGKEDVADLFAISRWELTVRKSNLVLDGALKETKTKSLERVP